LVYRPPPFLDKNPPSQFSVFPRKHAGFLSVPPPRSATPGKSTLGRPRPEIQSPYLKQQSPEFSFSSSRHITEAALSPSLPLRAAPPSAVRVPAPGVCSLFFPHPPLFPPLAPAVALAPLCPLCRPVGRAVPRGINPEPTAKKRLICPLERVPRPANPFVQARAPVSQGTELVRILAPLRGFFRAQSYCTDPGGNDPGGILAPRPVARRGRK